jgi:Flp pilus assembly protein TadB
LQARSSSGFGGLNAVRRSHAMLAGIILIVAGVLIAIFPQLLSWIVAGLLVFLGVLAISIARYNRKISRHYDNPVVEVFFRF